jgi:DNA polymerase-3 subunit alpha/error-prone DNA polymerase
MELTFTQVLCNLEGLDFKTAHRIVADRNTNGEYQSLENFINRIPIGIADPNLDFHRCLPFTTKTKKSITRHPNILVNYKPENRNLMLLQEPVKEYKLPVLERSPLKMPSTKSNYSVFQSPVPHLICCKQNTAVLYWLKDLLHHHKKTVKC